MKRIKIIFKIIIFCAIYIGAQALIKYALVDDTLTISRIMLHELYTEAENIDVLFCGASHCQLGVDPEVMDEGFGMNTFNAGSSSQGLETSLALIKEADRYHDIKQVYVDLDYSIVMRDTPNLESIYIISDYMRPSLRKAAYLLNATSFEYYVNSFMPFHKGRGYLKDPKAVLKNLQKKSSAGYRNYTDRDPSYAGKGHIASVTVVEEGSLWSQEGIVKKEFTIPEMQKEYLREIITYCKKNNIQLTFVSVPVTDFHLALVGNYDEYVAEVQNFLSEYEVSYYDFNLCNQEILALGHDTFYNDDNHLNTDGAKVFSTVFADFFSGRIKEDELFFDSYEQKMQNTAPRVLGMIIQRNEAGIEGTEDICLEVTPVVNGQKMQVDCEIEKLEDGYQIIASVDGSVTNKVKVKDEDLK